MPPRNRDDFSFYNRLPPRRPYILSNSRLLSHGRWCYPANTLKHVNNRSSHRQHASWLFSRTSFSAIAAGLLVSCLFARQNDNDWSNSGLYFKHHAVSVLKQGVVKFNLSISWANCSFSVLGLFLICCIAFLDQNDLEVLDHSDPKSDHVTQISCSLHAEAWCAYSFCQIVQYWWLTVDKNVPCPLSGCLIVVVYFCSRLI